MPETELSKSVMERRRHARTQLQMKIQCIRLDPDGGDVVDTLDITDISRSGVGAMCDRSFYPGQRILLCMPFTSMHGRRNIYATVIRCRQQEEGYHVGLSFDMASVGQCDARPVTAAA